MASFYKWNLEAQGSLNSIYITNMQIIALTSV